MFWKKKGVRTYGGEKGKTGTRVTRETNNGGKARNGQTTGGGITAKVNGTKKVENTVTGITPDN